MTTINTRNAMASFRMVDAVRFFSVLFFTAAFITITALKMHV